jgi:hypothetical protein
MAEPLFEERQRWPWFITLISLAASLLGWWALLSTAVHLLPAPRGSWLRWPDSTLEAVMVWATVSVLLPMLLLAPLYVAVYHDGVRIRFAFVRRVIAAREIASVEAVDYRPIRDFGGWGIRGTRKNRAYNVRGTHGAQLVLEGHRKLLIGSRRADELAAAINLIRKGDT